MKNNRWNPASKVNCNHISGMLAKGSDDYKNWVSRVFNPGDDFEAIVREGFEAGFLTEANVDTLLGTGPSTQDVKAAAAGNAQVTMISSLAGAGQHKAIAGMIGTTITQEQVDEVYGALDLDFAALIAPAPVKRRAKK